MIPTFEPNDTRMFTFTSSVAPDAEPTMKILLGSTVVATMTSVQSSTMSFYALFTLPASPGYYIAQWNAVKTFNSSARTFVSKLPFQIKETTTLT